MPLCSKSGLQSSSANSACAVWGDQILTNEALSALEELVEWLVTLYERPRLAVPDHEIQLFENLILTWPVGVESYTSLCPEKTPLADLVTSPLFIHDIQRLTRASKQERDPA